MYKYTIEDDGGIKGKIRVRLIEYSHDEEEHTHGELEMVYIVEGEGWHTINGKRLNVGKGSMLIMDADCVHSFESIIPFKYYNILICPSFLSKNLRMNDDIKRLMNYYGIETEGKFCYYKFEEEAQKTIEKLLYDVFLEYIKCESGYVKMIHAKMVELFVFMGRNCGENVKKTNESSNAFENAVLYIGEHCVENLHLDDVAEKFGYESTYFSRILKQRYGYSFKQLLINKRLDKVASILFKNTISVEEAAIQCGFTNKTFFYKQFEKRFGVKPKYIRRYSSDYETFVQNATKIKKSDFDTF